MSAQTILEAEQRSEVHSNSYGMTHYTREQSAMLSAYLSIWCGVLGAYLRKHTSESIAASTAEMRDVSHSTYGRAALQHCSAWHLHCSRLLPLGKYGSLSRPLCAARESWKYVEQRVTLPIWSRQRPALSRVSAQSTVSQYAHIAGDATSTAQSRHTYHTRILARSYRSLYHVQSYLSQTHAPSDMNYTSYPRTTPEVLAECLVLAILAFFLDLGYLIFGSSLRAALLAVSAALPSMLLVGYATISTTVPALMALVLILIGNVWLARLSLHRLRISMGEEPDEAEKEKIAKHFEEVRLRWEHESKKPNYL